MARLNDNFDKLAAGYLFPEIGRRTNAYVAANPGVKVMRLGIGNTTEPLTPTVIEGMHAAVDRQAHVETYGGYGDEQGCSDLRKAIAHQYRDRGDIDPSEVFVSDGAKPDSANIQSIFHKQNVVAVQDPAYPVYVDSNVIAGRTGSFDKESGQYGGLVYMACNAENRFIPSVPCDSSKPPVIIPDLIYLCSPNNPTSAVIPHSGLEEWVGFARKNNAAIIFDAAYSAFIKDPSLPKSIYEVDGAKDCAIEINSFSKSHGLTGERLGWTVVPKDMVVSGSRPGERVSPYSKVNALWNRRQCTEFNGASRIVQAGGLAGLTEQGMIESQGLVDFYMENAQIIKEGLKEVGLSVASGGDNAPYLWMETPNSMSSWDFFDKLLTETKVVGTPGSGFGPSGEGFFRLSAFGHREDIEEAVDSIKRNLRM
jgi:LL-diaminopimelate aminotransferase